jgi:hypothetical protein
MSALFDDDLSNLRLKEADEGLESPRPVTDSCVGVIGDQRRKSMAERKQPRRYTTAFESEAVKLADEVGINQAAKRPPVFSAPRQLLLLG